MDLLNPVDGETLFIDGKWQGTADGRIFTSLNPATGEVVGSVADATADDARGAVRAAAEAFSDWAGRTAYERAEVLSTAYRLMRAHADELAKLMTTEQGKPLRAARNEVNYAADFLSWFAEEAKRVYGQTIPSARSDQRFLVLRQPIGVVAAITPWNYPVSMLTRKIGPALAAGCTVVLKAAQQTPMCAVAVYRILEEAGVPTGVVNLLTTHNAAPVGEALLASEEVRKLTFTGSTNIGKLLGARSAETVKRVSLELGGHAPFIVCGDADPVHAAKGASLVKFLNMGQACISPNRIYVHSSIANEFIETFAERVRAMKVGSGMQQGVTVGPLIDELALDKMERHVQDAADKGAQVVAGGHRLNDGEYSRGHFFEPTMLTEVTSDMAVYHEETFGPIAAIVQYDDDDELLSMANDTSYGLASYIYTRDLSRALHLAEGLDFAIVGINDINPTSAAAPFGGMKQSGIGREGGVEGIAEYLETKLIGISI